MKAASATRYQVWIWDKYGEPKMWGEFWDELLALRYVDALGGWLEKVERGGQGFGDYLSG